METVTEEQMILKPYARVGDLPAADFRVLHTEEEHILLLEAINRLDLVGAYGTYYMRGLYDEIYATAPTGVNPGADLTKIEPKEKSHARAAS